MCRVNALQLTVLRFHAAKHVVERAILQHQHNYVFYGVVLVCRRCSSRRKPSFLCKRLFRLLSFSCFCLFHRGLDFMVVQLCGWRATWMLMTFERCHRDALETLDRRGRDVFVR